ncbi:vivax protein [Cystoisospora suis]|uniref:Vivax protein n=1 Tax=Cystoisospora suis TaxID=483139 RepID=A0A2C6JEJ7_9APIC|nr:vivax protein [Cystoisospora suis]
MSISKKFLLNLLPRSHHHVERIPAGRSGFLLSLSSPRLGSPKFEQKMLGSYPVSPEFEMVWRDRMTAHGGYIQQTISPYQLKFIYPFWHTFPARCWAKFSAYAWPWIWPGMVTFFLITKMHHDAEEDVRDKYWY